MKNWLDKMERRFGRYAIRNLTMYLLAGYAIGYLLSFTMPQLLTYFTLEPALILKGQVWRLLSWVIIPPNDNIIFVIFMMLLYYSLGNTLESYWGAFRYNVYIFSGILFTVIGAFIVNGLIGGITGFGSLYSTYYINMSIFLACASIMPDYQLLLYGIIPIKMKWLAILDVVLLAVDAVQGGLIIRIVIIASLLNFIIFFFWCRYGSPHFRGLVGTKKSDAKPGIHVRERDVPNQNTKKHEPSPRCVLHVSPSFILLFVARFVGSK